MLAFLMFTVSAMAIQRFVEKNSFFICWKYYVKFFIIKVRYRKKSKGEKLWLKQWETSFVSFVAVAI